MGRRSKCRDKANCFRRLELLEKTLNGISAQLERAHFAEYIDYVGDRRRVLRRAFAVGLLRGAGTAIGVTVLGAVAIWLIRRAAASNLPLLARFLREIMEIIEKQR